MNLGDIDEDGYCELAQYYSSCVSSFKHFKIWSFKNHKWKQYGQSGFTITDEYQPFENFDKLFKKKARYQLECLDIYDFDSNGKALTRLKTITIR